MPRKREEEEVERYTLIDLGGLDPGNITHASVNQHADATHNHDDDDDEPEPDFLWFGITERMHESVCLFSYTLGVHMPKHTPHARVMNCPPTSWWTKDHRDEVRRREPYDYAVWRSANAILDVRLMKMRWEVQRRMKDEGGDLTNEERERYQALADAGCLT